MTRFVRIDTLSKVCNGQILSDLKSRESYPNWTEAMCEWYKQNHNTIKTIHRDKSFELDKWIFVLEFVNEEEATMFMLEFNE